LTARGTQAKGEAEAFAISEKAKANAEVMKLKAEAFKEYKGISERSFASLLSNQSLHSSDAALIEMVLATLPKVAAEVAAPLANVERIKIVSGDGKDVGISRITGMPRARLHLLVLMHLAFQTRSSRS